MDDDRVQPEATHYVMYVNHPRHYVWATGGTAEHCDRECRRLRSQGAPCKVVERAVFEQARKQRVAAAAEAAEGAFWASMVESFPESVSGDLDPDVCCSTSDAMLCAADRWVQLNVPETEEDANAKVR